MNKKINKKIKERITGKGMIEYKEVLIPAEMKMLMVMKIGQLTSHFSTMSLLFPRNIAAYLCFVYY